MDDDNVYIMDVYNSDIYPYDQRAKRTLIAAELFLVSSSCGSNSRLKLADDDCHAVN